MSEVANDRPVVDIGDVIDVQEADYCYGNGDLTLRITAMSIAPREVSRLEWVYLTGLPIDDDGNEAPQRNCLVRVAALQRRLDTQQAPDSTTRVCARSAP